MEDPVSLRSRSATRLALCVTARNRMRSRSRPQRSLLPRGPIALSCIAGTSLGVVVLLRLVLSALCLVLKNGRNGIQQRPCDGMIEVYSLSSRHWAVKVFDVHQRKDLASL